MLFLSGCFVARGVVHTVEKGEDLWMISRAYGVSPQEVAEINNIKDPSIIVTGKKIFIPGVSRVRKIPHPLPASVERDRESGLVIEKDRFSWPVKGEIISNFGVREGVKHDGIDIKVPGGTPVKAADSGKVVYASSGLRDYGNIVIIKHRDDFYTVYAHNKKNIAHEGDNVSKGTVIAIVGKTGNAETEHLHFEVRQGKIVRNPLFFLP